ncbi:MAG: NAAT family transporter [Chlamydiia bacterium]|nr:NAAT family transporter [Chlamydiia bacterium]MCP5508972.1 NAAT family transporter [Chlamydiales bacterium]
MFDRYVISLFFVLNSIGNIPLFLAILAPFPLKRQRIIILREFLFAFIILLIFNFFGQHALDLIGIQPPIIGIAGGAVLFLIAVMMIFPHDTRLKGSKHEPMIVPLATPITAGPGTITAVMIFSHQASSPLVITGAIAIALGLSLIVILAASNIKRLLGEKGLFAIERLGGMILALIGVQMIMSGIAKFVQHEFFHLPYGG